MYGGTDNFGGYWGQWESNYGPMHRGRSAPRPLLSLPTPYSGPRPLSRQQPLLPSPSLPLSFGSERNPSLYYDFNAPARPPLLTISCAVQSIRADLRWSAPRVNKNIVFNYRMKISGGSKGEVVSEFPQWKTSVTINLEPGTYYTVVIEALAGTRVIAAGDLPFKAILCTAEIALLQNRAINFLQNMHNLNHMQEIFIFYRNKPPEYWRKIVESDGIMRPYLKDANGNPGCPINNEIDGLFFSARLHQGLLPVSSPFGGQRLKIMCHRLFTPETHHLYFCDFYCNTTVHYVTLIICLPNTSVDIFCARTLLRLDPFNNMYMHVVADPNFNYNYRYYVNNQIWVEMYYTADVPICWGEFDFTISLGQSKPNGVPNNKYCKICNLYPLESAEKDATSNNAKGGRKRSLTDADDDDDDTSSNKRRRPARTYVEVPSKISLTDDENSTFLLSMDAVKRMPNEYELVKPFVVDVVCQLVEETVKKCDGDEAKLPEEPTVSVCTSAFENSSEVVFSVETNEFLKELEEKTAPRVSTPDNSSENLASCVNLVEIKSKSEDFDSKTKKLFETLAQIKASMRNLDKKFGTYR